MYKVKCAVKWTTQFQSFSHSLFQFQSFSHSFNIIFLKISQNIFQYDQNIQKWNISIQMYLYFRHLPAKSNPSWNLSQKGQIVELPGPTIAVLVGGILGKFFIVITGDNWCWKRKVYARYIKMLCIFYSTKLNIYLCLSFF